jgi:dienelactone hydrolase
MVSTRMATLAVPTAHDALGADVLVPPKASSLVLVAEDVYPPDQGGIKQMLAELPELRTHATVRPDLLTPEEKSTYAAPRSNPRRRLLDDRLTAVVDWINRQPRIAGMPMGVLGMYGGAAAALVTAARRPESVSAVACVCGHGDRVGDALSLVRVPTLLLVEERNRTPTEVAQQAAQWLDAHLSHVVERWRGR